MQYRSPPLVSLMVLSGALCAPLSAQALALTSQGSSLGFSLSTFYSDPNAYYGALGVTTTSNGHVIMAGYARGELYLLPDVDGQTYGSISTKVSLSGIGSGYSVATAGGKTYFSPGFGGTYYQVDTTTLALTPLSLNTAVTPYLGLWANPVTGHLLSSSYSGLVDIDPLTGTVHVVTPTTGFDGVTVSPDGKTVYGENGGNIYGYDIATGTLVASYSGNGHSPDGTGVISGGALNGDIVVNNNDGTVGLIDAGSGIETIIADGGTRGDFVGPDLSNGTLFLASGDQVERLALQGATIGSNGTPEPLSLSLVGIAIAALAATARRRQT